MHPTFAATVAKFKMGRSSAAALRMPAAPERAFTAVPVRTRSTTDGRRRFTHVA